MGYLFKKRIVSSGLAWIFISFSFTKRISMLIKSSLFDESPVLFKSTDRDDCESDVADSADWFDTSPLLSVLL